MFNLAVIIIPATVLIAFSGLRLWKIGQNVLNLDKSKRKLASKEGKDIFGSIKVCNKAITSCIGCLILDSGEKSQSCLHIVANFYNDFESYRKSYPNSVSGCKWDVYVDNLWDSGMRFAELSCKVSADYRKMPNAECGQLKVLQNRMNDLQMLIYSGNSEINLRIDEIKEELDVFIKIYSRSFNHNNRRKDGIYSIFLALMNYFNTYLLSLKKVLSIGFGQD